jgi:hypothetical protein
MIRHFFGGQDRIRTCEGARPADLQSAPFDRFGTYPGAGCRIWTDDLLFTKQLLYH